MRTEIELRLMDVAYRKLADARKALCEIAAEINEMPREKDFPVLVAVADADEHLAKAGVAIRRALDKADEFPL